MTLACWALRLFALGVFGYGAIYAYAWPQRRGPGSNPSAARREDWTEEGWRRLRLGRVPLALCAAAAVVFAILAALGRIGPAGFEC